MFLWTYWKKNPERFTEIPVETYKLNAEKDVSLLGMDRDCEGDNSLGFQTGLVWGWVVAKWKTVSAVRRKMPMLIEAQGMLPWSRMKIWIIP